VIDWQTKLKEFKARLAQRLWALPTVTEIEKELVFKEYLSDLDAFENSMSALTEKMASEQKTWKDENELLRSIMGVDSDKLKMDVLTLAQEKKNLEQTNQEREAEAAALRAESSETSAENEALRRRVQEVERDTEDFRLQQMRTRENDIKYYSENHELLKNQVKDLETRIANLRRLFADTNTQFLTDKQEEITLLQKRLLDEMEATLRKKQEMSWAEEDMFAKGVAHRVRTALVSAQGQLLLTLERLGLLGPQSKSEAFWRARLKLLVEGAGELASNFKSIHSTLQQVTLSLDDYLHLTHRRELATSLVSLKTLVQEELSSLFLDRQPTLSVEFLPDDPLPDVAGDPALLKYALHALIQNAIEALPNAVGQVTIALKNRSDLGLVQVLVRDSGVGVPDHARPRLFQPFFSTKEGRQGLSLSRAKRYVEFHGGTLQLLESGGTGSLFQMDVPIVSKLLPPVRGASLAIGQGRA
jgi:signal transduction histidine kinase